MQNDGNLIIRDFDNKSLWTTHTSGNDGASFVITDGGQVAVVYGNTPVWLHGVPRGTYRRPPASENLQYPIRGAFYYPWYPETWTVNGQYARFEPDLGFYRSSDPKVAEEHIDALEYAYVDLSIASWWVST